METVTSLEKSLAEQVKQQTAELEIIRKEKLSISETLHQVNVDMSKVQANAQEFEKKYEVSQETISNLKKDNEAKVSDVWYFFK